MSSVVNAEPTLESESHPPRNEFKRRATLLGVGAVANQALQAITVPLIGRLYGPRMYGEWALLLNLGLLIATMAGLRYEQAVVIAEDGAEAIDTSIAQVYAMVLVSGLAFCAILWLPVSAFGHISLSKAWLSVAPVLGILTAISYLTTNCQVRMKRFGPMAAVTLGQSAVMSTGQIAGAYIFHRSFWGLIAGGIAGMMVPLGMLIWLSWGPRRKIARQVLRFGRTVRAARKHIDFARYAAPWALVSALRERGFVILLSAFTNSITVGYYSLALRLVWAPQGLATQSMSTVLYQRASEEKSVSNLAPLVRGILTKMILIGAPAFVLLAWWANDLLVTFLGAQWKGAGPFVVALCAPALTFLLQGWMTMLLAAVGAQRAGFLVESGYTVIGVAIFSGMLALGSDGLFAVQVTSAITVIYNLALLAVYYKMCSFPFRDLFRILGEGLLICAASVAIFASLSTLLPGRAAMIVSFVAFAAYGGYLALRWKGAARHSRVARAV